jgi:hypothetical protein
MYRPFKNNFLNIRLRNLSDSNQAVVGIVVAVLLIGLVVTILSVIQLIYVPNWMEEIESEHIDEVFNQFCQLKLVIDTQTAINVTDTPIATSITFGTNKIPFFMSTQAAGALNIINDASVINIVNFSNGNYSWVNYSLGSIRYTSVNAYYIPEEKISFVYENGALITDQKAGYSLNINPSFAYKEGTIIFNLVNINGVGGKISRSGYEIEHIRTELYRDQNYTNSINYIYNIKNFTIKSNYWEVWSSYINSSLKVGGLIYDEDFTIDPGNEDNTIVIEFYYSNPADYPDIKLRPSQINAQIGPGWIV